MYVYIESHLAICCEALLVFQILARRLKKEGYSFTASEVLTTLKNMNVKEHDGKVL